MISIPLLKRLATPAFLVVLLCMNAAAYAVAAQDGGWTATAVMIGYGPAMNAMALIAGVGGVCLCWGRDKESKPWRALLVAIGAPVAAALALWGAIGQFVLGYWW